MMICGFNMWSTVNSNFIQYGGIIITEYEEMDISDKCG